MTDTAPRIPIVIADDDTHIVYILKVKLEEAGYAVHVARNGEDALALAREVGPRLVVSDFNMPIMDGMQFAIALRESPATADIPVIMLTARGHALPEDQCRRTNIVRIESKPFSARHLISQIQTSLQDAAVME